MSERQEANAREVLDAIRLALEGAANDKTAVAVIRPVMMFTEMPECGTEFTVEKDDPVCPTRYWPCPTCGADVEVEWPVSPEGEA
jgi:hypothetical protein